MARRSRLHRAAGRPRRAGGSPRPPVALLVGLAALVVTAVVLAVTLTGGETSSDDAQEPAPTSGSSDRGAAPTTTPSPPPGSASTDPSASGPPAPSLAEPDEPLWRATFPDDGLVSNELAYREPEAQDVARSDEWIVTSGSLFADDGAGTSGSIDGGSPDARSQDDTGSAVLRAVTRRTFGDVQVDVDLRVAGMTTTERTPAVDFDGVHLFVRYADADNFYSVDLCRRDDTVTVKRKTPDDSSETGGEYVTLAEAPLACPQGGWRSFTVTAVDVDDGVAITLREGEREVLSVVDDGQDSPPPLRGPGRTGLRGDNTEFSFRDLTVSPAELA